ncbi:MAG: glycosyltransferase [Verrucomicrobia bacterium]|nr:MAG: glycosyltransferase [Verrucomicrobiota bacterium]
MKVLFNCLVPFGLAHGGAQIQIEETQRALQGIGVEVEPLRWWDGAQRGDILHHFGRVPANLARLAKAKGMKVVMSDLLTEQGSRPRAQIARQEFARKLLGAFSMAPAAVRSVLESYQLADACLVLTAWEAELLERIYGAPKEKIHVVPNGVETVFLHSQPATRGQWLVCTATITARKRVLELAEAAVAARTPLWIIGKPYDPDESCAKKFLSLAAAHPDVLRFEGPINDRAQLAKIYREARGFVLLSAMESLSLSALEAAACECPLLLGDLPWARTVFGGRASYCPVTASTSAAAEVLKKFYETAPNLPAPPKPLTWPEVAQQIKAIYARL